MAHDSNDQQLTGQRFRNSYLSYSRIDRFEQCPLSFKFRYVDRVKAESGEAAAFGKIVHATLEHAVRDVMEQELTGPLSLDAVLGYYRDAWATSGLTGIALFEEGVTLLKRFVKDQGHVDHRDVLAVEKRFELEADGFRIIGFIDRVDRVGDDTVEVIDYKTNRQLFSRDEVDHSLQMSLYHLAAQRLWPWAKQVKLTFHMLRHGIRMSTQRSPEQLEAALQYAATVGRMTESAAEFPAKLGPLCSYCDYRGRCGAYGAALKGEQAFVCADTGDLEAVAREREEVAAIAKVANVRKSELEKVLKQHLKEQDELHLAGVRYRMFNTTSVKYPPEQTLSLIAEKAGIPLTALLDRIVTVDKKRLEELLKDCEQRMPKSEVLMLKAEIEARADKSFSPRFWAKKTKEAKA